MVTLGASMTIVGAEGERTVPAEDFFVGVYMTAVGPGSCSRGSRSRREASPGDAFSVVTIGKDGTGIVNVAATLRANGAIEDARIAIGCVSAVPDRARAMEEALAAPRSTRRASARRRSGLGASLDPPSDVHASADYRRHLAEVMAVRATLEALGGGASG